jgi:hypothetical protein
MRTCLVALAACFSVAAGQSMTLNRAHLVISKTLTAAKTRDVVVKGEPFTITYTMLNLGEK